MSKRKSMGANAVKLAGFAFCCTLLVAAVDLVTHPLIAEQIQKQTMLSLQQVLAEDIQLETANIQCVAVSKPQYFGSKDPQIARLIYQQDQLVATVYQSVAPDGYNGDIHFLMAVSQDNAVTGLRVVTHNETPGLGDKMELRKSDWVLSFNGMSLSDDKDPRWAVSKDGGKFASFTGATITPRAIVKAAKKVMLYHTHHHPDLLEQQQSCEGVGK